MRFNMLMNNKGFYWEWDDEPELSPLDAILINEFSKLSQGESDVVLEIGVYKGGFVKNYLLNNKNEFCVGIDPYPNLQEVKQNLFRELQHKRLVDRFTLFENFKEYLNSGCSQQKPKLVHIDGEHSESAVLLDLEFAQKCVSPKGIIIIDDIFHTNFPGVASGTFSFLHNSNFAPFLITSNKLFICHEDLYSYYSENALKIMKNKSISYLKSYENGKYDQSNSIKGFAQLIVDPDIEKYRKFTHKNKIRLSPYERRQKFYFILELVFPGFLILIIRKIFRLIRMTRSK